MNKKKNQLYRIYSTANTGAFYMIKKSKKTKEIKQLNKYDKFLRKHVLFAAKKSKAKK